MHWKPNFKFQLFFQEKRIAEHQTENSRDFVDGAYRRGDGLRTDEIQISATIKTREQVSDLIKSLEILGNGLYRPPSKDDIRPIQKNRDIF